MSALNARPKPQISALSPALAISLNASASSADTRGNPASMRPTPSSSRARAISNFCDGVKTTPDRKSTRLNSSHSQISYAVFCLKKKKKQHGHTYCGQGSDRFDGELRRDSSIVVQLLGHRVIFALQEPCTHHHPRRRPAPCSRVY